MKITTDSLKSLGSTAFWTAAARAEESAREDRLFNDPWASALAGEEGRAWAAKAGRVGPMIIRTRYFDDWLQAVTSAPDGPRQVVILAAGLDTRAYRLDWPDATRLYELDQPAVLTYKIQMLRLSGAEPRCARTPIPADLTGDWCDALLRAGFDLRQPAAWLLEGFLFYLPNEMIAKILNTVSDMSAPGSQLGFDCVNSVTLDSPFTKAWIEMQAAAGAPWVGAIDDPEAEMAARGWEASITQPGAPDVHFDRWTLPVIPVKMPNMPHTWYVTARKEKKR